MPKGIIILFVAMWVAPVKVSLFRCWVSWLVSINFITRGCAGVIWGIKLHSKAHSPQIIRGLAISSYENLVFTRDKDFVRDSTFTRLRDKVSEQLIQVNPQNKPCPVRNVCICLASWFNSRLWGLFVLRWCRFAVLRISHHIPSN